MTARGTAWHERARAGTLPPMVVGGVPLTGSAAGAVAPRHGSVVAERTDFDQGRRPVPSRFGGLDRRRSTGRADTAEGRLGEETAKAV
jgi:hypothetical protein